MKPSGLEPKRLSNKVLLAKCAKYCTATQCLLNRIYQYSLFP